MDEGADLAAGVSLEPAVVEGAESPLGVLYTFGCEQALPVDGGSITVTEASDGWLVEGSLSVGGELIDASWTVAVYEG